MARPKKENPMKQYTLMLDPDVIQKIKEMADHTKIPAAKLARNMLMIGYEDALLFYKFGLLGLFGYSKKQIDKIKKRFNLTLK